MYKTYVLYVNFSKLLLLFFIIKFNLTHHIENLCVLKRVKKG